MTDKPGIKLAEYLETKGPLPGPQVAKLAIQLAQGMGGACRQLDVPNGVVVDPNSP